jgi:hypothetical protein
MNEMSEQKSLNANLPDLSWLIRLSDADYKKLKMRYADFISFNFRTLVKEMMKMEMLKEDEFSDVLASEVMRELVADESLPEKLRKELAESLKEEGTS